MRVCYHGVLFLCAIYVPTYEHRYSHLFFWGIPLLWLMVFNAGPSLGKFPFSVGVGITPARH